MPRPSGPTAPARRHRPRHLPASFPAGRRCPHQGGGPDRTGALAQAHWYGGDFRTPQAVEQLRSCLTQVYARYHKPSWLTEYALIDFSQGRGSRPRRNRRRSSPRPRTCWTACPTRIATPGSGWARTRRSRAADCSRTAQRPRLPVGPFQAAR
ncbi:glycosyl hydrolase [Streptomyces sp. NRRL B-24085]|uniref:glycosyl hydrolase n=1 Tax=Streptomyces sp. NRRL B-24085 TaxID=1709476 RepID=UPI002D2182CC|nr:glycosyl hydrolase [Streptomyces sp. NRRL B-24085]